MSGKVGAFDRIDLPTYATKDVNRHPFKVTTGTTSAATDALVYIQPGTVLGIVPNIGGTTIDDLTIPPTAGHPPTLSFNENGMVLLRVNIGGFSDTFRPTIADLTVNKQDGFIIKDDDGDTLNEISMIWDDVNDKSTGYFYIRVANVYCNSPMSGIPSISRIDQFLKSNVYSFVIVIDDVIILSS